MVTSLTPHHCLSLNFHLVISCYFSVCVCVCLCAFVCVVCLVSTLVSYLSLQSGLMRAIPILLEEKEDALTCVCSVEVTNPDPVAVEQALYWEVTENPARVSSY